MFSWQLESVRVKTKCFTTKPFLHRSEILPQTIFPDNAVWIWGWYYQNQFLQNEKSMGLNIELSVSLPCFQASWYPLCFIQKHNTIVLCPHFFLQRTSGPFLNFTISSRKARIEIVLVKELNNLRALPVPKRLSSASLVAPHFTHFSRSVSCSFKLE